MQAKPASRLAGLSIPLSLWAAAKALRYEEAELGWSFLSVIHQVVKPIIASLSRGQANFFLENSSKLEKAFQPESYFFQEEDAREAPRRAAALLASWGGRFGRGASMATMLGLAMGRYFPMDGFLWLVGGGWWGFGPVKIKVQWQKFIYGLEKTLI
jgi:hypothetical protein